MTGQAEKMEVDQGHAPAATHEPHAHSHPRKHNYNHHAKSTIDVGPKKTHGHGHGHGHGHHINHHHHHNHHHHNNDGNQARPNTNTNNNNSQNGAPAPAPAPAPVPVQAASPVPAPVPAVHSDHFQIPIKRVDPPKSREQKLQSVTIKELLKTCGSVQPVTLEPHTCVEKSLQILSQHRILSAPVVDPMGKVVGLVDVMDIMKHCLNAYSDDESGVMSAPYAHWCQDAEKIRQRAVRYALKPVRSLIGLSGMNPACPVYETGDMYQLAEVFAKGVRRVPVLSVDEKLVQVISQSTLVKYIDDHHDWLLAGVGAKTLTDLKLACGPTVISMHAKAPAIQGYFLILANKVSACAIVDGNNVLVGNLSASDLRDISLADLPDLLLNCEEFLLKRHKGTRRELVTCSPTAMLQECIHKLAEHKVHRVWVVDDKQNPVGVVSLTDILRIMVAPENEFAAEE